MPKYVRVNIKGGVFFFTVVLADRSSNLLVEQIDRLRRIYREDHRSLRLTRSYSCVVGAAGARCGLLDPVEPYQEWLLPRS